MPKNPRRIRCSVCSGLFLPTATTGRPRRYCSERCKRGAAYENTRINRHLERLERQRDEMSFNLDDPVRYCDGSTVRRRYEHICKLIEGYKSRQLEILDDSKEE